MQDSGCNPASFPLPTYARMPVQRMRCMCWLVDLRYYTFAVVTQCQYCHQVIRQVRGGGLTYTAPVHDGMDKKLATKLRAAVD